MPPPFSLKTLFFHWNALRRIPFPKITLKFDRVDESQTLTVNHRRRTVHLGSLSDLISTIRGLHIAPLISTYKFAIPRSWYRAQKPLKPGNTKKYEKATKSPPRVGPRKYEKNTEKIQKRSFSGHFRIFLYFFRIFGARPGVGDFVAFSYFLVFPGLRGFWALYQERGIASISLFLGLTNLVG